MNNVLVTGGAGFIGSNFVRHLLTHRPGVRIVNLDALTYAGSRENLDGLPDPARHQFVQGDICDQPLVERLLRDHQIDTIIHFAAESHVDRSIHGPGAFIQTNIVGTFRLLEAARAVWQKAVQSPTAKVQGLEASSPRGNEGDPPPYVGSYQHPASSIPYRFHHVSTDEVYGSLGPTDPAFTESTSYDPSSPYSASKAASDHLVRAYARTYGLPVTISNCSNNYGPYQFPEKLIPLMILNALEGKPLPVYGDGQQVRDWLYVEDHCAAIRAILEQGAVGATYNIGGNNQPTNLKIVRTICGLIDEAKQQQIAGSAEADSRRQTADGRPIQHAIALPTVPCQLSTALITHVPDRPGHDRRYAMDITKISRDLGWQPQESLATGLRKTVQWYLDNPEWIAAIRQQGDYQKWVQQNYSERSKPKAESGTLK